MARILITSMAFDPEQGGGSVRVAYELAHLLTHRGHEITVICEDKYKTKKEKENVNGMTILRYSLPNAGSLSIGRDRAHIKAVKKLAEKQLTEAPDIVHGHHIFQYSAALDLFRNDSRCCYTIHSPAIDELRIVWAARGFSGKIKILAGLPIIRKLEERLLYGSAKLTALSNYTIGLVARHYGVAVADKIQRIPGWIDAERFHPLDQDKVDEVKRYLGWPTDIPTFFVLRRLEPRMGIDNLLRALAIIKQRGFRAYVAIGGSGSMLAKLEKLSNDLNLRKDVKFMGFIPTDRLPLAYGACDASIIPSFQLECFGLVALESLACGRTTLVTPVGGLQEIIRNFEPLWIAQDATAAGLADIMVRFLEQHLPLHGAIELHENVRDTFSTEKAVKAYEQLLTQ